MALWSWWHGDPMPTISLLGDFSAESECDASVLVGLADVEQSEIEARLDAGHRAYVARLDGTPVSYGWVATLAASIGELDIAFALTPCDRYLWDFGTLPAWRGRGLYPRLLQAILKQESADARRFWIINAPENLASAAGIAKAGFAPVSDLAFGADHGPASQAPGSERARSGAALLGVPLFEAVRDSRVVSPCWRCVIAANRAATANAACWPIQEGTACTCA
ncbi:MAG: GNAT family N-acetyltransferase [Thermomicrobiales bacterium]